MAIELAYSRVMRFSLTLALLLCGLVHLVSATAEEEAFENYRIASLTEMMLSCDVCTVMCPLVGNMTVTDLLREEMGLINGKVQPIFDRYYEQLV